MTLLWAKKWTAWAEQFLILHVIHDTFGFCLFSHHLRWSKSTWSWTVSQFRQKNNPHCLDHSDEKYGGERAPNNYKKQQKLKLSTCSVCLSIWSIPSTKHLPVRFTVIICQNIHATKHRNYMAAQLTLEPDLTDLMRRRQHCMTWPLPLPLIKIWFKMPA